MAASLMLPLFGCAEKKVVSTEGQAPETTMFDRNEDGMIDRADWRYMKDGEKSTYARMSLEAIGENPDALVSKGKTREMLLLEGLEAIYGK
ncbi:MAG: hypothetical protein R8M46_04140 [Ghiorsea sp.]